MALASILAISVISESNLSTFSLSGTSLSGINFDLIEKPLLSYGRDTGKYSLRYLAKDTSGMFYDVVISFKLSNVLYDLNVNVFAPNMYIHSENFGNSAFSDVFFTKALQSQQTSILALSANVFVIN